MEEQKKQEIEKATEEPKKVDVNLPQPLKPVSEEERKTLQNAGKTTLQREQVRLLQVISQYLFAILLVMCLSIAVYFGYRFRSPEWLDSAMPFFLLIISSLITYAVHQQKLEETELGHQMIDVADKIKKTVFGRK